MQIAPETAFPEPVAGEEAFLTEFKVLSHSCVNGLTIGDVVECHDHPPQSAVKGDDTQSRWSDRSFSTHLTRSYETDAMKLIGCGTCN